MRTWMLALAAGLVLPRFLPALPAQWFCAALAAVGLLLLLRVRWVAPGLFLLGLSWACYQSQSAIDDRLPASMDGRTFWIEGRVVGLPSRIGNVVRFELDDIQSRHAGLPSKVRLSWYDGPLLQAGERWRLATVGDWQPAGSHLPQPDQVECLRQICQDLFVLYSAGASDEAAP